MELASPSGRPSPIMPSFWYLVHQIENPGTPLFTKILSSMVGLSYVLWTLALLLIIYRSYREKAHGMPAFSNAAMLSLCFITVWVGPWTSPALFQRHALMAWKLWAVRS